MNLTLSVDEELVEKAREVARQQGTSLNALIRQYLERIAGRSTGDEVADELKRQWAASTGGGEGWKFNREELYADRVK